MKKIAFTILALVLVTGTASAAGAQAGSGISVDLSANYASEPTGGFDGTFGLELGGNLDLSKSFATSKNIELQGRASLSYYSWDDDVLGVDLEYRRIPLFVGGRVLTPVAPQLKVYGQLGLEISFDEAEFFLPGIGRVSDDDVSFGLTPGVGILYAVSNQFYIGGNANWHIISDSYVTLGLTFGVNLP